MKVKLFSETIGTFFLLLIVVGSGIMGETLTSNKAIVLLANSTATLLGLTVLIWTFSSYSGSHFNPVVSIMMMLLGRLTKTEAILFVFCQVLGGVTGVMVANIIFDLSIISISENIRFTRGVFISEIIATFGLLNTILLVGKQKVELVAAAVGMYIGAAYWFTSSIDSLLPLCFIPIAFNEAIAFGFIFPLGLEPAENAFKLFENR